MSDSVVFSLRLPAELASRLGALAESRDRTKTYLAVKAIEEFVAGEEQFEARLAEGDADIAAGRMVNHEHVVPWLEDVARGKRRPPPQSRPRRTSSPGGSRGK
jgi:predicted transcriptional regulator